MGKFIGLAAICIVVFILTDAALGIPRLGIVKTCVHDVVYVGIGMLWGRALTIRDIL